LLLNGFVKENFVLLLLVGLSTLEPDEDELEDEDDAGDELEADDDESEDELEDEDDAGDELEDEDDAGDELEDEDDAGDELEDEPVSDIMIRILYNNHIIIYIII
jgi:hypothetical protein